MSKAAVFMTSGTEEVEALMVVDMLRRAKIDTTIVAITEDKSITGSHNITVLADNTFEEVDFDDIDILVLPGGMPGTLNLKACKKLTDLIGEFDSEKKGLAAVCAAPTILGACGVLKEKKATCFPGFEDELACKEFLAIPVVKDENVITSRGLGTTIDFAAAIIEYCTDKKSAEEILDRIVYKK